ncbi:hypothetical protein ACWFNE_09905 [Cellulomonas sp. NPDC055163]
MSTPHETEPTHHRHADPERPVSTDVPAGATSHGEHLDPRTADDRTAVLDPTDRDHPDHRPSVADPADVPEPEPVTVSARDLGVDRQSVVAREKEEFGGIKIGSAFFGWLTATGTAVLLTALVAGAGTAVGVATNTDVGEAADQAASEIGTVGAAGSIALLVVLFLAYYCGGYVAGRMARFNGAKQGLAVWLWAVVIAIVVAILTAIAGEQFNVLARLDSFPRIPLNEGDLTTGGIVVILLVAVASLAGAVVGGLAGMRFHRRVDRAGLGR